MTDLKVYDRIILRYPTAVDLSYKDFLNTYGGRFITEHHADVIGELRVLEQGVLNPIRIHLERRNAPKILSQSCGIIGVTDEIRRIYLDISGGGKPSTVIPNGIAVKSVPFSGFQSFTQDPLKLLFVSSTFYAGHGLDRLLRGLSEYRGNHTISLTLVGKIYRREEIELLQSLNNPKVKLIRHEQLDGEELDRVFSQANLAVSTLALFRDGITQACPLKTREYMARGLPFIYSYEDMDLEKDLEFLLKIPANDGAVQIDDLFKFVSTLSHLNDPAQKLRQYAEIKMDWSVKMEKMYDFAYSII
ncbi:MAG: glycosyltransferase [Acidobacteria bacterium]|nr:glycosyltransferase [Acidobacteriota bacterium]